MDSAGATLYVLGVAVGLDTRIVFTDMEPSALGRIWLAGSYAWTAGVADRRLDSYALVYLTAGTGRFIDELGCDRRVAAGDLLLMFPGLRHSYGPSAGEQWSELFVVFDGPAFDLWRASGLLDPRRPVHRLEPIERWLHELRWFVELPRPLTQRGRELRICRFLHLLTAMLETSEQPTWLERAQQLLTSHLDEPADLGGVAAELDMSYETFRKRFRRATGASPGGYRSAHRFELAHELLTSTAMSHREIAVRLGFRDEFHFSKRFKRWSGSTPRDVRRAARRGEPGDVASNGDEISVDRLARADLQ